MINLLMNSVNIKIFSYFVLFGNTDYTWKNKGAYRVDET